MTMSADPFAAPRAANGRAPDVFKRGGWMPMRQFSDAEIVDFAVVGTGAGGGPLLAGLAENGFSVVGFDAGPYFRPLEDFASDEREQDKLYWTNERVVDGANPITMGGKNSGRAVGGSAEIRDLAMVSRIEMGSDGRATGVHYHREGRWRFQKARNVVVAGYAIETPRLLFASATDRFPDGLANSSGLVGKNLMTQSNQAVFGVMEQEVRWNKGPPSLSITEHWNYDDRKDFAGGYCWMAQGPLPVEWATVQTGSRGLWGQRLRDEMEKYNHQVGLKMVGEMLPDERNRVTLADDKDQYGLRVARVTYSWGDNDKALIQHALGQMQTSLEAVGATDIFRQENDTNHLAGTARMGDDPATSVVNADCHSWDIPNLWVCDGSVFPTTGGVNPSLTITSIAMRTADRIHALSARGEL